MGEGNVFPNDLGMRLNNVGVMVVLFSGSVLVLWKAGRGLGTRLACNTFFFVCGESLGMRLRLAVSLEAIRN